MDFQRKSTGSRDRACERWYTSAFSQFVHTFLVESLTFLMIWKLDSFTIDWNIFSYWFKSYWEKKDETHIEVSERKKYSMTYDICVFCIVRGVEKNMLLWSCFMTKDLFTGCYFVSLFASSHIQINLDIMLNKKVL